MIILEIDLNEDPFFQRFRRGRLLASRDEDIFEEIRNSTVEDVNDIFYGYSIFEKFLINIINYYKNTYLKVIKIR